MSGTNRTREAEAEALPKGPEVVLVRPQLGENIGAAARAMWNFGLDRLRLVAPRDGWPAPRAVAMASGATRVLDGARLFPEVAEAVDDLHYVYATTARSSRDVLKPVLTPEQAMADAVARMARGEKVGLMFGPERAGLENEDLLSAQAYVTVPANPAFASLNLGQCVLLLAYEWRRQASAAVPAPVPEGWEVPAARGNVDRMLDHLEAELTKGNYFWPEDRGPSMRANLRNLFHRAPLTDQDLRTLWGVIRTLAEGRRRR